MQSCTSSESLTDRLGILVSLALRRSTRILAVVGELVSEAMGGNSVGVYDGSTTAGDHGPDATLRVQYSKLERSTGRAVKLLDVSLFLRQITTEWRWPDLRNDD